MFNLTNQSERPQNTADMKEFKQNQALHFLFLPSLNQN